MRRLDFIIFLSIIIAIYGALNFYIFSRGWEVVWGSPLSFPYIVLFLILRGHTHHGQLWAVQFHHKEDV
jgi:hypothetical protein